MGVASEFLELISMGYGVVGASFHDSGVGLVEVVVERSSIGDGNGLFLGRGEV